ncbi:OB-fold domain-containing protein [Nocardia sp. NPDC047038]|uniref:Zn-ribbon domain-containing OB-fold protein n=1 Tax=Nocardia sp. NPDC047038 TaxID=3154338 RepID=UPI0033F85201
MYTNDPENIANISNGSGSCVEDTLMIRRCGDCNKVFWPLTTGCSSCESRNLEWVPSSGVGSIVSWRVVHFATNGRRHELVPLTIAIVELDDGPWIYTTIDGGVPAPGNRPVRVQFLPRLWEDRFPVFAVIADLHNSNVDVHQASPIGD